MSAQASQRSGHATSTSSAGASSERGSASFCVATVHVVLPYGLTGTFGWTMMRWGGVGSQSSRVRCCSAVFEEGEEANTDERTGITRIRPRDINVICWRFK
jgi:hypothetical protein